MRWLHRRPSWNRPERADRLRSAPYASGVRTPAVIDPVWIPRLATRSMVTSIWSAPSDRIGRRSREQNRREPGRVDVATVGRHQA